MNANTQKTIREYINMPPHIRAISGALNYDLMHGPSWIRVPDGDVTRVTSDDLATYRDDLECYPGDIIEETYCGIAADAFREWIASLPSTLYYDDDCDYVSESEPQPWFDEETEEWIDPSPYYELSHRDIMTALFGKTFAREFA
jgi:hypothetical protein